jgi:hypothetical protein
MNNLHLLSDHVYDWSDHSIRKVTICVAKAQAIVAAQTSAAGCGAARLFGSSVTIAAASRNANVPTVPAMARSITCQ